MFKLVTLEGCLTEKSRLLSMSMITCLNYPYVATPTVQLPIVYTYSRRVSLEYVYAYGHMKLNMS